MAALISTKSAATMAFLLVACMAVQSLKMKVEARPTCRVVSSSMSDCIPYLKGTTSDPNPACCVGVRQVKDMGDNTFDRQTVCGCLKKMTTAVGGINLYNAARLPGQCGVSVSFPMTPDVDCSKIG